MLTNREACCAVSRSCKASPGYEGPRLRTECFSCGLAVCTAPGCSIRTEYFRYGVQRICVGCLENRQGESPVLTEALRKLYALEAANDGHAAEAIPGLVDGYILLLPT